MNPRNSKGKLKEIALRLQSLYHDFNHYNKSDPLDELLFILCSVKTSNKSYLKTFDNLKNAFPTPHLLLNASHEQLSKIFSGSGLQNQKALAAKKILTKINETFGEPSLEPLIGWPAKDIEYFLMSLPGVGKKVARCVMMYSLNCRVFPVDTHCWRIFRRLGLTRRTTPDGSCSNKDMDRIQAKVPPELMYSLHVNMVSLGRELCVPRTPKCTACPISDLCPKIGTKYKLLFRT